MEPLLEGIEENRQDALYLFITDVLRDATAFRRFFANLMTVLPHNFSVHRIEVGHEFLKHVTEGNSTIGDKNHDQRVLFRAMCDLESLRTMIISDGYVQRKDNGSIVTPIFLQELPRARSLVNLDVHRMELANQEQVQLLATAIESIQDSLEDLRLTGLLLTFAKEHQKNNKGRNKKTGKDREFLLDPVMDALIEMPHIKSLAISLYPGSQDETVAAAKKDGDAEFGFVSPDNLKELCQLSTLQDLMLRHLHLNDAAIASMSKACECNSFLTTLDLRQNKEITPEGYGSMLRSLNRNFSSWCTVLVDDPDFQGRFNVLIELNQADRGDVVRNFGNNKLQEFLQKMENPSAVWYFLQLHDTVRTPLADYLLWKAQHEKQLQAKLEAAAQAPQDDDTRKRKAIEAPPQESKQG